jgi:hypothetical protein
MPIILHQHRPMLRRIGILVNLIGDKLPNHRLFGKPLPRGPGNGMPANVHGAGRVVDARRSRRDHIRLAAEAERVLELELALQEAIFSGRGTIGDAFLSVLRGRKEQCKIPRSEVLEASDPRDDGNEANTYRNDLTLSPEDVSEEVDFESSATSRVGAGAGGFLRLNIPIAVGVSDGRCQGFA